VAIAKPPLKWVGGKTKLLPELVARMPKTYGRYHEPFVGGGALFFHLAPARASLSDMNGALIRTYRGLARDVIRVIDHLKAHKYRHGGDAAYYYAVRDDWNSHRWQGDPAAEAAAFIYLNKTCFNGLWRENRKGEFNVPRGLHGPGHLRRGQPSRRSPAAHECRAEVDVLSVFAEWHARSGRRRLRLL